MVATSSGLVAYSGVRSGNGQTAEFIPVANYPGLTADVRAKLGEMKVTPVTVDVTPASSRDITGSLPQSIAPKAVAAKTRARL